LTPRESRPGNDALRPHVAAAMDEAASLAAWLRDDEVAGATLVSIARVMATSLRDGGRLLSCGNGGSMCDAMHFAEELSGRFHDDRPAISAMAISDASHLTCVANDYGFEQVFARGVEAWGRAGDVLLAFSTSGNSPNVLAAAQTARRKPMTVVGLLGKGGGRLLPLCEQSLVVPSRSSDRIQEIHIKIVHVLIELIERQLHPGNYPEDPDPA
jgi:D-sedoheptulose 7-phosphate isomerase